jgi:branched-chain amino acid transport system permease protein
MTGGLRKWLPWGLAFLVALAVPAGLDPEGYLIRVLCLCFLFAAMGQSWNIIGGLTNQVSLGHAAFFGIGAYTSTLLLVTYGLTPWIGMLVGAMLAGLAAFGLSFPTMNLRGHYFALATLAFGEVMRIIANSWSSLTGGPVGISVPYRPDSLLMLQFSSSLPYYYIFLGAVVVATGVFMYMRGSRMGYRLRAVRENQEAAEVIGVNTRLVKIQAAVVSAALMGIFGTLYAQFQYFFDPDTVFGLAPISVRAALVVIIGGMGTAVGPILGAFFVIPMEEIAIEFFSGVAGFAQFVYGALLIAVIVIQPRGFVALIGSVRSLFQQKTG